MTASAFDANKSGHHIPVLLNEVVSALKPKDDELYLDGTFGAGGYCRAVLEAADCNLIAIDRDPEAIERATSFKKEFPGRFEILRGTFGSMDDLLAQGGKASVDGVMLDIGVSSFQIDEAGRGFSFQEDGPLDMRMSGEGESAADVVNGYGEEELANIIYTLGEERKSRWIASSIVARRADAPFERTLDLANLVERVIGRAPAKKGRKSVHPATRTFQALRIHVNDELGELRRGLCAAERILAPEGRLVVVSFHSLEDRIVKAFMAERSGNVPGASRHLPMGPKVESQPQFRLEKRGVIKPTRDEEQENPRARSAKLRVAIRTSIPPLEEVSYA